MFVLQDMAIDAIVIVLIMVCAFVFAYILTAIIGEWRARHRAWSAQRQRRAQRHA